MAITNNAVASKILSKLPQQALLKRQPVPDASRLQELQNEARRMGLVIDASNTHAIQVGFVNV